MAEALKKDIGKIIAEGTQIDEAAKQTVKEAVLRHKNTRNSIVGHMVWLKPEEIKV
jgi:hypothetical protein